MRRWTTRGHPGRNDAPSRESGCRAALRAGAGILEDGWRAPCSLRRAEEPLPLQRRSLCLLPRARLLSAVMEVGPDEGALSREAYSFSPSSLRPPLSLSQSSYLWLSDMVAPLSEEACCSRHSLVMPTALHR